MPAFFLRVQCLQVLQGTKCRRGEIGIASDRKRDDPTFINAFQSRTTIHAQLQVLGFVQTLGIAFSSTCCAINKSSRKIICHSLVNLLICAILVRFEDNSYL
uniref:Uncharacterized protein n=1 Tax=Erpetoichthys calabaricus TaxID=27687 RepID=A0A8C4S258_ERPCA